VSEKHLAVHIGGKAVTAEPLSVITLLCGSPMTPEDTG